MNEAWPTPTTSDVAWNTGDGAFVHELVKHASGYATARPAFTVGDPFDPALHMYGEDVDLGLRAAVDGVRSWFDPTICRLIHHGQGSSTVVYGSREAWRPAGTLNWRAAVRRAYGSRREWLAWRALRLNLRLRLLNARLSLLTRDEGGYREDLRASQAWIQRYFDGKSRHTTDALAQLKQLSATSISFEMPTISESLEAVRGFKSRRERTPG